MKERSPSERRELLWHELAIIDGLPGQEGRRQCLKAAIAGRVTGVLDTERAFADWCKDVLGRVP